jgi:hypothetical protein
LVAFKNTVESDQETSLVQAVATYVRLTSDSQILQQKVGNLTTLQRLERALRFVRSVRWDPARGLVWSGATVDWGDVQAGVDNANVFTSQSQRADGVYANAMLSIALREFVGLPGADVNYWSAQQAQLRQNIQRWLWDDQAHKYRAHVYLAGSPFPPSFDENAVNVHGGTAVAALAGLLTPAQLHTALQQQDGDVVAAHANSIGLTVWPPYPGASFRGVPEGMMNPGSYQNAGDWDWFGARMVQALTLNRDPVDAYRELRPMVKRVLTAAGFHEWWDAAGQPHGSAGFRGAAGEVGLAIIQLQSWARNQP